MLSNEKKLGEGLRGRGGDCNMVPAILVIFVPVLKMLILSTWRGSIFGRMSIEQK